MPGGLNKSSHNMITDRSLLLLLLYATDDDDDDEIKYEYSHLADAASCIAGYFRWTCNYASLVTR